jgi:hypothetical protein
MTIEEFLPLLGFEPRLQGPEPRVLSRLDYRGDVKRILNTVYNVCGATEDSNLLVNNMNIYLGEKGNPFYRKRFQ